MGNEYLFRGISETSTGPAYQLGMQLRSENGLYAQASALRVDFPNPGDERTRKHILQLGLQRRFHENFAIDASINHYQYHGSARIDYDWSEFSVSAAIRDRWSLQLGIAKNWLGQDKPSSHAALGYRHPIGRSWVADLTIGHQQIDRLFGFNYSYGQIGLARALGPIDLRVGYSATDGASRMGARAASRWLVQVSWRMLD